jgi:hypothetical protein
VPSSSDVRIEELCAKIRELCRRRVTAQTEGELRKLAKALRLAINEHVNLAKSSLNVKRAAIVKRDIDPSD